MHACMHAVPCNNMFQQTFWSSLHLQPQHVAHQPGPQYLSWANASRRLMCTRVIVPWFPLLWRSLFKAFRKLDKSFQGSAHWFFAAKLNTMHHVHLSSSSAKNGASALSGLSDVKPSKSSQPDLRASGQSRLAGSKQLCALPIPSTLDSHGKPKGCFQKEFVESHRQGAHGAT